MSQPDRKDRIPYQPSFRHLMDELARTTDAATLTRITRALPSTIRHGEFDPQTVRGIFIETVRSQREDNGPQFASVNALLDVGQILTPHIPATWSSLVIDYQEIRPLVAGVPDNGNDRSILIDKFKELNKGMMRRIIGEENETDDFADKLKSAYLAAIKPSEYHSQSDILTLLAAGQIISPYLPKSPTTLSDIQATLGSQIDQIYLQMPPKRAEVYVIAYQQLLDALQHPETTIPVQKPKSHVIFEQAEKSTVSGEKQAKEARLVARVIELRSLTGRNRLTNKEIAKRLFISESRLRDIMENLYATGIIDASDFGQETGVTQETRNLRARIKELRDPSQRLSNKQIAAELKISLGYLRNIITDMIDAGELEIRSSGERVIDKSSRRSSQRPQTEKIEFIIQDDVERLRLAYPALSKEEIAERLSTEVLTIQPYQVKNAITALIAAGRLKSNKGFQQNPETAAQLAQVKALRNGKEYVSDAEIASQLGIDISRVHALVNQLLDSGEIAPRPHPGKTGPTEETLAIREQIKALRQGTENLSRAEIAARVGRSENYVKKLIREMFASGELER